MPSRMYSNGDKWM